jgi:hypothetical protein
MKQLYEPDEKKNKEFRDMRITTEKHNILISKSDLKIFF